MKNVKAEKVDPNLALWELEVQQVEGKSLERKGRDEINDMLSEGWIILSVYTLRFKNNDDTWLERPMAILGLPKHPIKQQKKKKKDYPESVIL
jgi:hypothetical protein